MTITLEKIPLSSPVRNTWETPTMQAREVVWPPKILDEFRQGTLNALKRLISVENGRLHMREGAPEVVALPLRSGPLAATAFLGVLRSGEVAGPIPHVVMPDAGRPLMWEYHDYMDEVEDNDDPMIHDFYFHEDEVENIAAFNAWIDRTGYENYKQPIYRAAERLKVELGGVTPEQVFVVDDLSQHGITKLMTTALFGLATGSSPSMEVAPIFPLRRIVWDRDLMSATFPEMNKDQTGFLAEIIRGTLNVKELRPPSEWRANKGEQLPLQVLQQLCQAHGDNFLPINEQSLWLLDKARTYATYTASELVLDGLKESLGLEYMQTLHTRVTDLFLAEVPFILDQLKQA